LREQLDNPEFIGGVHRARGFHRRTVEWIALERKDPNVWTQPVSRKATGRQVGKLVGGDVEVLQCRTEREVHNIRQPVVRRMKNLELGKAHKWRYRGWLG
jgi:hypothetical protein